ncbi:hypothetical protein GCM10010276_23470 [Streptomyces longisporus]|uniref:Uncharacterized protein n=1 Tax=Streptomyces longisporus TaxID=1948 RepID=A0ABN3LLE3_STRLO
MAQDPQRGSWRHEGELADRFHPEAPKFNSLSSADTARILDRLRRQELFRLRRGHVLDAASSRAGRRHGCHRPTLANAHHCLQPGPRQRLQPYGLRKLDRPRRKQRRAPPS